MAVNYCTIADVKLVAAVLSPDVRKGSSLDAEILSAIDEASNSARQILNGRYDLATIDASPPATVKHYTAYQATWIIYCNGLQAKGLGEDTVVRLNQHIKRYRDLLERGDLFDDSNVRIEGLTLVEAFESSSSDLSQVELQLLYERGR